VLRLALVVENPNFVDAWHCARVLQ
jgi:hypothetical protein